MIRPTISQEPPHQLLFTGIYSVQWWVLLLLSLSPVGLG